MKIEPGHDTTDEHLDKILTSFDTAFLWRYDGIKDGLEDLYRKAKQNQWDGEETLDWSLNVDPEAEILPREMSQLVDYGPLARLDEKQRAHFAHAELSLIVSNFLHGEQGAMIIASQLVSMVPWMEGKLYASTQTMDEARHVEVFERYLREKLEWEWPINAELKKLIDATIEDSRWDIKFLGMQIIIEGIAMASFGQMHRYCREPLLRELFYNVMRDEARHVAFGVKSLAGHFDNMSASELRDREDFVIWACELMRNRMVPSELADVVGWDREEVAQVILTSQASRSLRAAMFSRVVPNLERLGMLTPRVRAILVELDLAHFEKMDPEYEEKRLGFT